MKEEHVHIQTRYYLGVINKIALIFVMWYEKLPDKGNNISIAKR